MAIRHGAIIWQSVAMAREAIDASVEGKRSRKKRRWSDFTRAQQTAIVVGAAAEVVMTTFALRDLARRPARAGARPKASVGPDILRPADRPGALPPRRTAQLESLTQGVGLDAPAESALSSA